MRTNLKTNLKTILISAVGNNNELGKDNKLLWYSPSDLKSFKELTNGYPIIMGRKTFESLPGILPNRLHLVVSSNTDLITLSNDNVIYVPSFQSAVEYIESKTEKNKCFVIGGAQIYSQVLEQNLIDEMYITYVNWNGEADTYFPNIDYSEWEMLSQLKHEKDTENDITWIRRHYGKRQ